MAENVVPQIAADRPLRAGRRAENMPEPPGAALDLGFTFWLLFLSLDCGDLQLRQQARPQKARWLVAPMPKPYCWTRVLNKELPENLADLSIACIANTQSSIAF